MRENVSPYVLQYQLKRALGPFFRGVTKAISSFLVGCFAQRALGLF